MERYTDLTDEQLICRLRGGEKEITDYIMEKYKNLVRKKAKAMFLLGGENDDLIQEGMIGLFKAIRDYDLTQNVPFAGFADLCISRQIYSAIAASKRKKHLPLNSYVSIYDSLDQESEEKRPPLIDTIESAKESNPETLFLDKEYMEMMESELKKKLSKMENQVLKLHLLGMDYHKIAGITGKSPKAIDNALQRIKSKAQEIFHVRLRR